MNKFTKILLTLPLLWTASSFANNPGVDVGESGYVTWSPILMFWGKGGYMDVITGPGNFGWGPFHYEVQRINTNAQTYPELFHIVDKNQIKIDFEVAFRLHPSPAKENIRILVEHFGGADWYKAVAQQPLRSFVRDAIGAQDSQTLSVSQEMIEKSVTERALTWIKNLNLPIELDQVSVGNFQFPEQISQAAAEKQAAIQRLQAKSTLLEIAKKDAEIEAAKAEGIRRSQDIINQTLTPLYIAHEMVQAIERVADKPGNSVIYVPIGANGLPIIGAMSVQPVKP